MKEIERFALKAADYKRALEECPCARLLELYPILWHLDHYTEARGRARSHLRIVDLMSGSGFLADKLVRIGYSNVDAIEFCKEMTQDSSAFAKVRLHQLSTFDHLEGLLEAIKPDIIISLASFHHLLEYNTLGEIDKTRSVGLQKKVVEICMRSLKDDGMLLVEDLIEEDVAESTIDPFKGAMRRCARQLHQLGLEPQFVEIISEPGSIRGVSSGLHKQCGGSYNGAPLKWFRDVVDAHTLAGHKDIAISNQLITELAEHRPYVVKFGCPWVFSDLETLKRFLFLKFGFAVSSTKAGALDPDAVLKKARDVLGVRSLNKTQVLGWNLGIVVLWKGDPFEPSRRLVRMIRYLCAMAVTISGAIALRLTKGDYVELSIQDTFVFLLTLPLGAIIGELFGAMDRR